MKISRAWLQTYFEDPLPDTSALSGALTFHAFEIDGIEKHGEDEVLDVKVTANRGHDCLSHRGIAKEISVILEIPMKDDPFRKPVDLSPRTNALSLEIDNPALCPRHVLGLIRGVKVGPSPEWLRERLESVGQRSINNVVDATNFVMHGMGQPTHVFDADKLTQKDTVGIRIRGARKDEEIELLGGVRKTLSAGMLVLADIHSNAELDVAGIKGGRYAELDENTKNIVITGANFDGVSIRKTAQTLKLRTDASARFEQGMSPELAAYGMRAVADLIVELAGGEIVGFVDMYPSPQQVTPVSVLLAQINNTLGTRFTNEHVSDMFTRLDLVTSQTYHPGDKSDLSPGIAFSVVPPFERLDLVIPEDLTEEVGRIIGYDNVPAVELPPFTGAVEINPNFYAAEHAREELVSQGYSEVFTSVFAEYGDQVVANKVDGVRPYLRTTLLDGLSSALQKNIPNKDLLGLKEIKLFEIGTVWKDGKEITMVGTVSEKQKVTEHPLHSGEGQGEGDYEYRPLSAATRYQPFSKYPFIARDISLWVPQGTSADDVLDVITQHAGELLVRLYKFDEFAKGEKVSYAFRLVFQSFDRTLFDGDANARMESVYAAVKVSGWEVR